MSEENKDLGDRAEDAAKVPRIGKGVCKRCQEIRQGILQRTTKEAAKRLLGTESQKTANEFKEVWQGRRSITKNYCRNLAIVGFGQLGVHKL